MDAMTAKSTALYKRRMDTSEGNKSILIKEKVEKWCNDDTQNALKTIKATHFDALKSIKATQFDVI